MHVAGLAGLVYGIKRIPSTHVHHHDHHHHAIYIQFGHTIYALAFWLPDNELVHTHRETDALAYHQCVFINRLRPSLDGTVSSVWHLAGASNNYGYALHTASSITFCINIMNYAGSIPCVKCERACVHGCVLGIFVRSAREKIIPAPDLALLPHMNKHTHTHIQFDELHDVRELRYFVEIHHVLSERLGVGLGISLASDRSKLWVVILVYFQFWNCFPKPK